MKYALICNYYIENYGSALQSFALYEYLKNNNLDVKVVCYKDYATKKQKLESILKIKWRKVIQPNFLYKKITESVLKRRDLEYRKIVKLRSDRYKEFIDKYFEFTEPCKSVDEVKELVNSYDTVILSSDQLWGPEDLLRGYHTLSWVPNHVTTIAYATSFGVAKLSKSLMGNVANFIPKITQVSVRERSGAAIIKTACGSDVPVVVDPTLLLTRDEWMFAQSNDAIVKDKYIFYYFLGDSSKHRQLVKEVSKSLNCKLVSVRHAEYYEKESTVVADELPNSVGPAEFINLIRHAEYVVSDSFHATIFSIIFHKKFLTFNRYSEKNGESRNTRIDNLLADLGLETRHCKDNDTASLQSKIIGDIDYAQVDKKIDILKRDSLNYLKNVLGD